MTTYEMELCRVDVPDSQGDMITRESAEKMCAEYKGDAPLTKAFSRMEHPIGRVLSLRLKEDRVLVTIEPDETGAKLIESGASAALCGLYESRLMPDPAHKEITSLELVEVGLVKEKVPYPDMRGGYSIGTKEENETNGREETEGAGDGS